MPSHHPVRPVRLAAASLAALVLAVAPRCLGAQARAIAAPDDTARVTLRVTVLADAIPVAQAIVRAGHHRVTTNVAGGATFRLAPGAWTLVATKIGFTPDTLAVTLHAGADTTVVLELERGPTALEDVAVTVRSTRAERRIEDQPLRVEVLAREEIEEKLLMTPGDISMMLNESGGMRVQNTSPSLGGANVRIQGLRGRYSLLLADGLPLYGGQAGGLGLLQVPPMDLAQVEVIKGAASALYGSSALGGVINLLSRHPAENGGSEMLLNGTTLGGADAVLFASGHPGERWGYTVLAGGHRQGRADRDRDGWTDVPGYERIVARPRVFVDLGRDQSLFLTGGATLENRAGGTMAGRLAPDGSPYPEDLTTRRFDGGSVGRFNVAPGWLLTTRASGMTQRHGHVFGPDRERDRHTTMFAEAALSRATTRGASVLGAAVQADWYRNRDLPVFDFTHTVPGLFAHQEWMPAASLTLAGSARLDHHSTYGTFVNPRLSALVKTGRTWSVRASAGTGYYAPTPFTEETEVTGLARLAPIDGLRAERARSASLDVGGTLGPLEVNGTLFGSVIDHSVQLRAVSANGAIAHELINAAGPTRTWGAELLARYQREPWHLTASYTFTRSTETDPEAPAQRREVALTPRHALGIVGMWESEGRTRIGVELYYTGRQALEDNPYRATSRPYVVMGLLAEHRVGPARLFVNFENLTDVRQTKHDRLVLPARAGDGRWTTDAWAPLEGRVVNGGVRIGW